MKTLRKTVFTSSALLFILSTHSFAGEVKMYVDRAPSAQEMGTILFSGSADQELVDSGPKMKLRSIRFNVTKTSVPTVDTVGLPIQFAYNSAEILQQSRRFLNEVGKMMALANYSQEKLMIEGHTDASGSSDYNQFLSEKRAQAVKHYLVVNHQISENRLTINGRGETSPLTGKNPFDATNRRVQFYKTP